MTAPDADRGDDAPAAERHRPTQLADEAALDAFCAAADVALVERFDVQRVPLLVLFVDGDPVARRDDGFVPGDDLTAWIREETDRQVSATND